MDKFVRTSSVQEKDFGLEIKLNWPEEHSFLGKLEDLIICGICKEFYQAPMSAPCGHSFCSKCFRLALAAQQATQKECPLCHSYMDEADLRKNIPLEAITTEFQAGRKKLKNSLENLKHQGEASQELTAKKKPPNLPRTASTKLANNPSCPLCNQSDFGGIDINIHIDGCLSRESGKDNTTNLNPGSLKRASSNGSSSNSNTKRSNYMTKPIYDVMPEKQLKKLLKDLGLSTLGDKSVLQRRHAHYVTLYNANCDVPLPKPSNTLRRELEAWERVHLEKKKTIFSSNANIKDENYLAEHNRIHKADIKKLIEKARPKRKAPLIRPDEIDCEPTAATASKANKRVLSPSSQGSILDFQFDAEDLNDII